MDEYDQILLKSTDTYITPNSGDAYFVADGSVMVFAVPLKGEKTGRRFFLCRVGKEHWIPSYAYRDQDYVNWRFIFVCKDDCKLLHFKNLATSVLYESFAERAHLHDYALEGFDRSIVEFYRHELLKDHIYIEMEKHGEKRINIDILDEIKDSFYADTGAMSGDEPVYRTVQFACKEANIDLMDADRINEFCGNKISFESIAQASRFGCRKIVLEPKWYKRDSGVILGDLNGQPVACVPGNGEGKYTIFYGNENRKEKLSAQTAESIDPRAHTIYRTLPDKKLGIRDLIDFGKKSIRKTDIWYVVVLSLIGALIGILLPTLNQKIYDEYIPLGDYGQLIQICIVIASFMISALFFDMVKNLSEYRISSHINYDIQNAVYYRMFHLPESFFREQESADLAQRLSFVGALSNAFVKSTILAGISFAFSLLYLFRMFKYSKNLSWIAMILMAVYCAVLYLFGRSTIKFDKQIEENRGEASSKLYQFLNGIEKLRMAGVEDRAAYEYMRPFAAKQSLEISKNKVTSWKSVVTGASSIVFSMIFYYLIVRNMAKNTLSTGSFMAFNSAFGAFSAAFISLISGIIDVFQMKPLYERIKPVFETPPEDDGTKSVPGKLTGRVMLNGVKFSYEKSGRYVLNGIDLDIKPGEYIGIVGSSGCGKSTLLKLLLGFEDPDSGQVCYDGHPLNTLNKRAVRKNLGVVLQNGRLIAGSIYENITITAPNATKEDVQKVIEAVGLKSDIDQMPMGIHTMLSENSGTISGGQQQRILIARAIIGNPSILIFDEATSALDNSTQASVCESLDKMNITRIVVAHRLSTIKNCDRIIALDGGKIIEEGSYDQLMEKKGFFYNLAIRQIAGFEED